MYYCWVNAMIAFGLLLEEKDEASSTYNVYVFPSRAMKHCYVQDGY